MLVTANMPGITKKGRIIRHSHDGEEIPLSFLSRLIAVEKINTLYYSLLLISMSFAM
jgi:hypothetical protein